MSNIKPYNQQCVSIIIPTYNRKSELKKCLESLLDQTYNQSLYEIIIVDDGSTDGTEEIVHRTKNETSCLIRYFKQSNKGAAAARNIGIKNSQSKYIAFIDSDCFATKEWLQSMIEKINFTDKNVIGIGGKILNGIDSWVGNAGYFSEFYNCFAEKSKFTRMSPTANLCLKKEILDEIGYFDESLRTSQDTDLCWRIAQKGYKILYDPDVVVTHFGVSTFLEFWNKQMSLGKGFIMTRKKHKDIPPVRIPENIFVFGFMIPFLYIASLTMIYKNTITVFGLKVIRSLPLIIIGRAGYWIGALKSFKKENYS